MCSNLTELPYSTEHHIWWALYLTEILSVNLLSVSKILWKNSCP